MCSYALHIQRAFTYRVFYLLNPRHRPRRSKSCSRRRHTLWSVWERVPPRDRPWASLLGAWMVGLQLLGKQPSWKLTTRSVADHILVVMIREFLIELWGLGSCDRLPGFRQWPAFLDCVQTYMEHVAKRSMWGLSFYHMAIVQHRA